MKPIVFFIVVAGICVTGCEPPAKPTLPGSSTGPGSVAETKPSAPPTINTKATEAFPTKIDLAVVDWQGVQARVAAQKGKIVVLDAWSTTCGPCVKEFPKLVQLHRDYAAKGVACMSFNCDYDGIPEKPPEHYRDRVVKFLEKQGATFENLMANVALEQLMDRMELASIPAVYVYGRDGKLAKRFDNEQIKSDKDEFTYEQITQLVEELLKSDEAAKE